MDHTDTTSPPPLRIDGKPGEVRLRADGISKRVGKRFVWPHRCVVCGAEAGEVHTMPKEVGWAFTGEKVPYCPSCAGPGRLFQFGVTTGLVLVLPIFVVGFLLLVAGMGLAVLGSEVDDETQAAIIPMLAFGGLSTIVIAPVLRVLVGRRALRRWSPPLWPSPYGIRVRRGPGGKSWIAEFASSKYAAAFAEANPTAAVPEP